MVTPSSHSPAQSKPSAPATAPAAPAAGASDAKQSDWIREAPRMRVFHDLSPICERSESLLRDPEVGFSKSYSVTAPSIELRSLLAKGPTELAPLADGLGGIGGLRAAALKEREGALMEMTFSFASRPSSDVDAVAKRNGFAQEHEAWLKRASKPGEWSISVDSSSDSVDVMAFRNYDRVPAECNVHPGYQLGETTEPAEPGAPVKTQEPTRGKKSQPARPPSDAELLDEMLRP